MVRKIGGFTGGLTGKQEDEAWLSIWGDFYKK
jgi:hypothetical protein